MVPHLDVKCANRSERFHREVLAIIVYEINYIICMTFGSMESMYYCKILAVNLWADTINKMILIYIIMSPYRISTISHGDEVKERQRYVTIS